MYVLRYKIFWNASHLLKYLHAASFRPGFKKGTGRPSTNWRGIVKKDLWEMGLTWEEAEVAALNRQEWCRSVAQYVHMDVGWIKSSQVSFRPACRYIMIDVIIKCNCQKSVLMNMTEMETSPFKVAVLVFQCLSGNAPTYLVNERQLIADISRCHLHSTDTVMCAVRRSYNTFGDRCFTTAGPSHLLNSLPSKLWQCDSLREFKRLLMTHLFGDHRTLWHLI